MLEDLRDGYVPGSYVSVEVLASVLAGALLTLLAARLLARRAPAVAAGAGLVLLLVAVLRALADAADVLSPGDGGPPLALLAGLALAGLAVGTAASRAADRRDGPGAGTGLAAAAVVLAHVALFAPYDDPGTISFGEPPPEWLAWLRVAVFGALAAGALAALHLSKRTAAAALLGLLVVVAAPPLLDGTALHAAAAGLALGVLLPVLVRTAPGAGSSAGLLLGVVLVLGAVTADDALDDAQEPRAEPELGLEVVSNEEYDAFLRGLDRDRSVPVPPFGPEREQPDRLPG